MEEMNKEESTPSAQSVMSDYVVVKAMGDGVTVIGLTRGKETRISHTEKLDAGEVWVAQFTEDTAAVKIRGHARIWTRHGEVESGGDSHEQS